MPKSITAKGRKPPKPYPDFPLFPHATRRWAKKINGKFHYFGPWDDHDAALQKYIDQREDLHAGRTPRPKCDELQLRELLNHFLTAKERKLDSGDMKSRTLWEYHSCGSRMVYAFGAQRAVDDLRSDDFGRLRAELARTRGPVALGNEIQRVRSIFKYGYDAGLLDKPIRFGPEFVKPSQKVMRQARHARGEMMFKPQHIQEVLGIASVQLRAMILLGINAGYGNTDVASLPLSALDPNRSVIDFPRPKTAIPRRVTLWRETADALQSAIDVRPDQKDVNDQGLVFITKRGLRWVKTHDNGITVNTVGKEFGNLLDHQNLKRPGLSFYALRHTFRTVADETRDQPAIDLIMGHEDLSKMATRYGERISDERLRAVTNHVRAWFLTGLLQTPIFCII